MTKIAILGGGSWGTALSIVLSRSHKPHEISLWMRDPTLANSSQQSRENKFVPSGMPIPAARRHHHDLATGITKVRHHRRSHAFRVCAALFIPKHCRFRKTTSHCFRQRHQRPGALDALRMSEVVPKSPLANRSPLRSIRGAFRPVLRPGSRARRPYCRCGRHPKLDSRVRKPRSGARKSLADYIQAEFAGPSFRLYTNDDVVGVELAGAMKNVMAIAAGTCQGLGLGTNAIAALITRGLAEMSRLAMALGARAETLSGLAGLRRSGADLHRRVEPQSPTRN